MTPRISTVTNGFSSLVHWVHTVMTSSIVWDALDSIDSSKVTDADTGESGNICGAHGEQS
jgi:hypothetical protein